MLHKIRTHLVRWLIYLLLFFVIAYGINFYKSRDAASGQAPALGATTIGGEHIELRQIKQPLLVHFWASWCPVCSLEQQTIESISRTMPVVSVALQSGTAEELRDYMQQQELTFPVIADDDGRIAADWGVRGVPTSFIINSGGEIQFVEVGYTSAVGLRLRLWLAGL